MDIAGSLRKHAASGALAGVLLLGLAFRLYVSSRIYLSNIDSGTVGLMGLHILEGERPLFFYGQAYMGALEAYLAALLFAVFGVSELTLSLSPILFSIAWIAGTYMVFRELFDTRVGLAAALCLAIPNWSATWYSMGSYGGYPAALAAGTWCLWLVLRIVRHDLSPKAQWAHVCSLGLLAGLGMWSNYLTAAYLATGAVLLVPYFARIRFRPVVLARFAVGGLFLVLGFAPVLVALVEKGPGRVAQWHPALPHIRKSMEVFWDRCASELVFWPTHHNVVLQAVVLLLLLAACALWVLATREAVWKNGNRYAGVPFLFLGLFAALYLPHAMAHLGAQRYVLPFSTMMMCAAFAVPLSFSSPGLRRAGIALLALWLTYNLAAMGKVVAERTEDKRVKLLLRDELVHNVERSGLRSVLIVSSPLFAHNGQRMTFWLKNRVRFVSAFDERYQPGAQAADSDPGLGLICESPKLAAMRAALDQLRVTYDVLEHPWASLVYNIKVPAVGRGVLPPDQVGVELTGAASGDGLALVDRVHDTFCEGSYAEGSGFTLDLGSPRLVEGLWLTAPDWLQLKLPAGYRLSVSEDGHDFHVVAETGQRIALSYTCGDRVFMKGYFGMQEIRFEPVRARYMRCELTHGQRDEPEWQVNEVFVLGHEERANTPMGVDAIAETIRGEGITFTVADRWLSARLWDRLARPNAAHPVYPHFNSKQKQTVIHRSLTPHVGMALAPAHEVADECERMLRTMWGEEVAWRRKDFGAYALLTFTNPDAPARKNTRLVWNGHTLLQRTGPPGDVY